MDGRRGRVRRSVGSLVAAPRPGYALIQFKCVRPDHARRSKRYTLTIRDGRWAFCRHEGPASEHDWRAIAGTQIDSLLEQRRFR